MSTDVVWHVRAAVRRAGERVIHPDELDGALARAFAYDGPALVEVITDADLV